MLKDELIQFETDDEFLDKLKHFQKALKLRTLSATIRFIVDREYRQKIIDKKNFTPKFLYEVTREVLKSCDTCRYAINRDNALWCDKSYNRVRIDGYMYCPKCTKELEKSCRYWRIKRQHRTL